MLLAVPGHICSKQNLPSSCVSLVAACEILVVACRIWLLDEGPNLGPLHWVQSLSHWTPGRFQRRHLVFEAGDPNVEWHTKIAECNPMSSTLRKKIYYPDVIGSFFSKGWAEPNPVRNQNLCHQCQGGVKLQLALRLPSLTILRLCRLPPLLPPPVSDSSCRSLDASPCVQLSCCSTFKVLYFKIKNVFFIFVVFLMYYL